jgi:ABC-type dipeptide/oligopeptide/nickel transport system permease component
LLRFLLKRLGLAVVSVWVVCTVVFFLAAFAPGDPVQIAAGGKALSPAAMGRLRHTLGLDKPLGVRYGDYLWNALHGNLGRSFYDGEPVTHFFARALPNTALLALVAIVLALLLGLMVGILAALRPNSWLDRALMAAILTGVTLPTFVLAPVLVLIFALKLGWLPVAGWNDPLTGAIEPQYVVLPAVVLAARPAALIGRLTRSSLLETLQQDYIRTARAKGLSPWRVLFRHALPNALLPVLTSAGVSFGYLLSGSFVVETIFTVPGVGYESIHSLATRDYSLIQGTTLLLAVIFVTVNLLVDVLYVVLDPRIRLEAS